MTNYKKYDLFISGIAAFSTLAAVIWMLFKETILARWRAPRLELFVHMDAPYVTIQEDTYYYHLGIKNTGKSTAQKCHGYIDEIYEYKNGRYERIKNFIAMPLFWAKEEKIETFIGSEQEKFLDLGTINFQVIYARGKRPFTLWFRAHSDTDKLYAGKYRIKINIYSENTRALSRDLEITWSGESKEKYNDMLNELIIKQRDK